MPDVSIKRTTKLKKTTTVVFIEVLSETLKKTIRRLYYVLVLQLIYTRSLSKGIFEVSGFVLPIKELKGRLCWQL